MDQIDQLPPRVSKPEQLSGSSVHPSQLNSVNQLTARSPLDHNHNQLPVQINQHSPNANQMAGIHRPGTVDLSVLLSTFHVISFRYILRYMFPFVFFFVLCISCFFQFEDALTNNRFTIYFFMIDLAEVAPPRPKPPTVNVSEVAPPRPPPPTETDDEFDEHFPTPSPNQPIMVN